MWRLFLENSGQVSELTGFFCRVFPLSISIIKGLTYKLHPNYHILQEMSLVLGVGGSLAAKAAGTSASGKLASWNLSLLTVVALQEVLRSSLGNYLGYLDIAQIFTHL